MKFISDCVWKAATWRDSGDSNGNVYKLLLALRVELIISCTFCGDYQSSEGRYYLHVVGVMWRH
jgi:hypothetical protein